VVTKDALSEVKGLLEIENADEEVDREAKGFFEAFEVEAL
jgi:hypothetical protein